jgi:ATP-dependent helicase HrpB
MSLLKELNALHPSGELTAQGRRIVRMPLPPRLSKFLLTVEELSKADPSTLRLACRLAAWLQGEDLKSEDLLEELRKPPQNFESKRLEEQLAGWMKAGPENSGTLDPRRQTFLAQGLLTAFPDRVAKLRDSVGAKARDLRGNQKELVLSQGGSVTAPYSSLTSSHAYFVVLEAQEITQGTRTQAKARTLCPIEEDWLLDFFPGNMHEEKSFEWNPVAQKVEGFGRLLYGQLVLEEKALAPGDFGPEAQDLLYREALAAGPSAYCNPEELEAFLSRLRFTGERAGDKNIFGDEKVREALKSLCEGRRSFEDLRSAGFFPAIRARLSPQHMALVEKLAPASVLLPSGRRMVVHYEEGKPPWGESRIQDFFGMKEGPRVSNGEVGVVLHLLSPAKRAMQVTSDLAGFWERHYPALRKELSRRYPRHKWPENPLA